MSNELSLPGAVMVLEQRGYNGILTPKELGAISEQIPAEDVGGRRYLQHAELDTFVKEATALAPPAVIDEVQRTTIALMEFKDTEADVGIVGKVAQTAGMAIGAVGAIVIFFNPVLGAPLALIGAGTAGVGTLWGWFTEKRRTRTRNALLEDHQQALSALLQYRNEAKQRATIKRVASVRLPQPTNEAGAGLASRAV